MNRQKKDRILISLLPVIILIAVGSVVYFLSGRQNFLFNTDNGIENVKTILGVWGTILGFMITSVSILVTMGDNNFLKAMKDSGHFVTILYTYVCTCFHLLMAVIFAIVLVFGNFWCKILFALTCAFIADTFVMVAICLFFLFCIVLKFK